MQAVAARVSIVLLGFFISHCRHTVTPFARQEPARDVLTISPDVLQAHKMDWSAMSQHVEMKVPYAPIEAVRKEIEAREGMQLQSRGEAHITVITPLEMDVLRTRLSLEKINGTIAQLSLQSIPFQPLCLGRGQLRQDRRQRTYYVVVQAPGLFQVREKLRQQFLAAGGDRQAFMAEKYWPHITVGFTERDLYPEDGVIKDSKSCVYKVE